jgi:hypothetical protein
VSLRGGIHQFRSKRPAKIREVVAIGDTLIETEKSFA